MSPSLRQLGFLLALTLLLSAALLLPSAAGQSCPVCNDSATPDILPLSQIKPGMKGYAETIFAGDEIERMDVEVLGVLPNLLGPKQHVILVLLKGPKVEHTGVVAGMSGSPVYLEGKLAGALSLRVGVFAKEPLAGVTPIESMLEIASPAVRAAAGESPDAIADAVAPPAYPIPTEFSQRVGAGGAFLTPIETPLVFSGFHAEALRQFSDQFSSAGLVAVQGGTTAARPDDADLKPGDMASMVLMQGDLSATASCTVSAVVGDRVLLCGHPVLGYGGLEAPMARARVVTTLASSLNSIKIANTGGVIGSITDDRLTALVGRVGPAPRLIPLELTTVTPAGRKEFHVEVLEHPKLTAQLVAVAAFNSLVANVVYNEGMTFQLSGQIELRGHSAVNLENMFAPTDLPVPDGFFVVTTVAGIFTRIFTNPYERARIERITLRIEAVPERRLAIIDTAWSEKSEVSPGEAINVKVLLRPYRGAPFIREVPIVIPAQVPRGPLRILVSDSDTLNRIRRFFSLGPQSRLAGLEQLIALLNRERRNDRVYVTLLQPNPTLLLEDKELPNVPTSQINVLDQRRATGSSLLMRESVAGEWSARMNQVIAGQHVMTITVR